MGILFDIKHLNIKVVGHLYQSYSEFSESLTFVRRNKPSRIGSSGEMLLKIIP